MTANIMRLNRFLAPILVAFLIASGGAPHVLAQPTSGPSHAPICETERGRPSYKPVPPGQLVRRGLVGDVVGLTSEGHLLIGVQFGVVEVIPPAGFDISTAPVGSRVAALLEKEKDEGSEDADGTSTPPTDGDGTSTPPTDGDGTSTPPTDGDGTSTPPADDDGTSTPPTDDDGTSTPPTDDDGTSTPPTDDDGTSTPPTDGDGTSTPPTDGDGTSTLPTDGDGTSTPPTTEEPPAPFRVAQAKKITVIPGVASRQHVTGVVTGEDEDSLEVLTEDGEVEDIDFSDEGGVQEPNGTSAPPTDGDATSTLPANEDGTSTAPAEGDDNVVKEDVEEGTDATLLVQCAQGVATVKSVQKTERIAERLERIQAKLEAADDRRAEKLADLQAQQEQRKQDRLERTSSNAPAGSKGKVDKARGKPAAECDADDGTTCPDDSDKGQGGGNDNSDKGQGGGNDNSDKGQGGGNDNSDKGKGGGNDNSNKGKGGSDEEEDEGNGKGKGKN